MNEISMLITYVLGICHYIVPVCYCLSNGNGYTFRIEENLQFSGPSPDKCFSLVCSVVVVKISSSIKLGDYNAKMMLKAVYAEFQFQGYLLHS